MAYSVLADVQIAVGGAAKLLQLTDHDGNGIADSGVVDAAIAEADAFITSYAGKRWTDVTVPLTVKGMAARMAARILRRNRLMALIQDLDDEKLDREWLTALARGDVTAVDAGAAASSMVVDKAEPRDTKKNVSRERTKGFW